MQKSRMSVKIRTLFVIIYMMLLAAFLTGCSADTNNSEPTPKTAVSTKAPKPTATPKETATPKATATKKTTATPKPTATKKQTATPKPTSNPKPTGTVIPTEKPNVVIETSVPTEVNLQTTNLEEITRASSGYAIQTITLREKPSRGAKALSTVNENDTVEIIDQLFSEGENWYLVDYQKGSRVLHGYLLGDFITATYSSAKVYDASYSAEEALIGVRVPGTGEGLEVPENGKATIVFDGVGAYSGQFASYKRSGKGTFVWVNGDRYEGDWKNDQIEGKGTLTFADGIKYEGTFSKGKLTEGTVTIPQKDGRIATRKVQNSQFTRDCVLKWPDGTTVTGKLWDNGFSGEVTISYSNGDIYVGTLKSGLKSGTGKYTWKNGANYNGSWENDMMNGQGTYYFSKETKNNYIKGRFKNNNPDGTVTYYGKNGLKYNTTWENGVCKTISYQK